MRSSRAIVSFTFDDFPSSAYYVGAPILQKYGLHGTYYTSLGLAGKIGPGGPYFSEPDLQKLLVSGHELGCHTFEHCHAWRTRTADYERSIIKNRERLKQILPNAAFTSHSYPINIPRPCTKAITSRYFACARGGLQRSNVGVADANYLRAFFIEKSRDNLPAIKAQIERAKAACAWLIFATHDLRDSPGPFGCRPEIFEAVIRYAIEANITILPISRALESFEAVA